MGESDTTTTVPQESSTQSSGKCPVDHENGIPTSLWKLFGNKNGDGDASSAVGGKVSANAGPQQQQQGRPVASLEEAAKHAQSPHPTQRLPLSTYRMFSSIPRGTNQADDDDDGIGNNTNSSIPHHQIVVNSPTQTVNGSSSNNKINSDDGEDKTKSTWVYPSEQQVFNAMKRKGWDGIEEESIPSFLQIHNFVNERSWRLLCEWEKDYNGNGNANGGSNGGSSNGDDDGDNGDEIKLVRFEGRPTDMTPKAFLLSTFGLQPKPFDRHDWYIDNGTDRSKRYVLDFYMRGDEENDNINGGSSGGGSSSMLPRVDIDVRPALDTPQAFIQRGQRIFKELFPGISKELETVFSTDKRNRR